MQKFRLKFYIVVSFNRLVNEHLHQTSNIITRALKNGHIYSIMNVIKPVVIQMVLLSLII